MPTIRLKISESVFEKSQFLISRFKNGEIEILSEDQEFLSTQNYLQKELDEVKEGKASYHSQSELDDRLDKVICKYDDSQRYQFATGAIVERASISIRFIGEIQNQL